MVVCNPGYFDVSQVAWCPKIREWYLGTYSYEGECCAYQAGVYKVYAGVKLWSPDAYMERMSDYNSHGKELFAFYVCIDNSIIGIFFFFVIRSNSLKPHKPIQNIAQQWLLHF